MILKYNHILSIIEAEDVQLKNASTRSLYIRNIFRSISPRLFEYFNPENILLHKAYFVTDKGKIKPLEFKIVDNDAGRLSSQLLKHAEKMANTKGSKPLTRIILERHINGLVLYAGKSPKHLNGVVYQNLDSPDYISELSQKLGLANEEEIKYILEKHKAHKTSLDNPIYFHFIRPFNKHKLYNGVFLIILRRALREKEFVELGNLWTKILSGTVMNDVALVSRAKEQELIFDEQTHTLDPEVVSLYHDLDYLIEQMDGSTNSINAGLLKRLIFAHEKALRLHEIVRFNLYLMKTRGLDSKKEIESMRKDEPAFAKFHSNQISLKKQLINVQSALETYFASYEIVLPDKYPIICEILKNIKSQIDNISDISVWGIETGAYIVLYNLVKNAIKHNDLESPHLTITLDHFETHHILSITNANALSPAAANYINGDNLFDSISMRKGGLRTIKRILSNKSFNPDNKWSIGAFSDTLLRRTVIKLTIFKD